MQPQPTVWFLYGCAHAGHTTACRQSKVHAPSYDPARVFFSPTNTRRLAPFDAFVDCPNWAQLECDANLYMNGGRERKWRGELR